MKDGVNRDTKIEVGDKVRVVRPHSLFPHQAGFEFIVENTDDDGDVWGGRDYNAGELLLFTQRELEIMEPQAALKSVYAEKERMKAKHKKAYELCEKINSGYIHWDDKMAALKEIFEDE